MVLGVITRIKIDLLYQYINNYVYNIIDDTYLYIDWDTYIFYHFIGHSEEHRNGNIKLIHIL